MTKLDKRLSDLDGLVSIARKAGYVIAGQDNLRGYDKKLYLILLDVSAGNSLCREMNFLSQKRNVEILTVENVSQLTKIENCKVVGIKNKNFADEISKRIKGE